jgi:DNA helicase IV
MQRRNTIIPVIRVILMLLSVVGIFYLLWDWLYRKPLRKKLLSIEDQVLTANDAFLQLTNFDRYFANYNEQQYKSAYRHIRNAIKPGFEHLGLNDTYCTQLKALCHNYDYATTTREQYNNEFVSRESVKYGDFFNQLEAYPLSADQIEAIIRDEDNNLVIAGAGTGKTTTIAGKVAYILEKGLAAPEELLVISFTKNAVNEMYDRCIRFCQHIPSAQGLTVKTFNSYGFLVSRTCSPNEIRLAFDGDDGAAKTFLQEKFDELFIQDDDFYRKAVNFMAFFNRPPRDEFEFETPNDYLTHEKSYKNITLDGKKVNSKEEMEIGNFFCLFGVNYEYQKHFPLKEEDRNPEFGVYQPDFYLPDHQIWHEHYGIAENGDVPKWFSTRPPHKTARDYYHAGMDWKEQIHTKYKTRLIKTFSHENKDGKLIAKLKERLIAEGVELRERDPEELLELFKKSDHYADFMALIYTFLGLMKSNGKTPDQLFVKGDKRFLVFMDVFKPLYQHYEAELRNKSSIDYNDMINHAAQHFRGGKFTKPYQYILVDEFQDMSLGRYELIKTIRQQNPGVKLYAVGDDWQSIFRFTGSDISIITQFEKQFGYTRQTAVLKTYRFNGQILATSSDFIQKNPSQIQKQLTANQPTPEGHVSFEFIKTRGTADKLQTVNNLMEQIASFQADATVYLIGRYHFNCPADLQQIKTTFPGIDLSYHTAHAVKGKTCDYAILLDVDSGPLGFPSEIADDPLLNHLLHEGDGFENAEERRVFYVAITRARHKNFLLYNEACPSKFILELTGQREANTKVDIKRCPKCNGVLVERTGPYSKFYGCSNYPQCEYKLKIKEVKAETV